MLNSVMHMYCYNTPSRSLTLLARDVRGGEDADTYIQLLEVA